MTLRRTHAYTPVDADRTARHSPPARVLRALLVAELASLVALGCAGTGTSVEAPALEAKLPSKTPRTPWTNLDVRDAPDDFDFVVVTDRTGEHREGVFAGAVPKVNLLRPAFVMSVGDLIEGYTDDRAELAKQWDEFAGFVAPLSMPFFYLPGNHDMSNETMSRVWQERFGASYYHFLYKDTLFVGLNSELFKMVGSSEPVPGPDTLAEQLTWLEEVLDNHRDARWTFVFVHQPLWDASEIHPDWLRVEEWLGDRDYTVFAGHYHAYTKHVRHDRSYLTLATTGGGSRMRGLQYGEFDHVVKVSMREDGPTIANLLLDGIQGEDVRTLAMRRTVGRLEKVIRPQAMRFEGSRFRGGSVRFALHNDSDAPVEVQGRFEGSRDFELAEGMARMKLSLPPNSVEEFALVLRARDSTPFESLAPGTASWTVSTVGPAGEVFEIETVTAIAPGRLFPCSPPAKDVVVDGVLGEWSGLPFSVEVPSEIEQPENHQGPEDASFRFAVRCGKRFLYVAIDVIDDSIVASPERIGREQDGISLTVDARPDPERSAAGSGFMAAIFDGTMRSIVTLSTGPAAEPARDSVLEKFLPPAPEGTQMATRRTQRGYRIEIAVPVAALDAMRGAPYDAVRLDLSLRDFDEDGGHSILWWRPSRFSKTSIPGSGTFIRK